MFCPLATCRGNTQKLERASNTKRWTLVLLGLSVWVNAIGIGRALTSLNVQQKLLRPVEFTFCFFAGEFPAGR
jgi:hypothetical protein